MMNLHRDRTEPFAYFAKVQEERKLKGQNG